MSRAAGEGHRFRPAPDCGAPRQGTEGPRDDTARGSRRWAAQASRSRTGIAREGSGAGTWAGDPAVRDGAEVSQRGDGLAVAVRLPRLAPVYGPAMGTADALSLA